MDSLIVLLFFAFALLATSWRNFEFSVSRTTARAKVSAFYRHSTWVAGGLGWFSGLELTRSYELHITGPKYP